MKITALFAIALFALASSSQAVGVAFEDWEAGTAAWTVTGSGATQDCTRAFTGACSLKLNPPCCGAAAVLTQSLVPTPLLAYAEVSFAFQGSAISSDTDTGLTIKTTAGDIALTVNDFWGPNNRVSLFTPLGSSRDFARWNQPNAWYEVTIKLDALAGTAVAELTGPNSGVSAPVPIPAGASITGLQLWGVSWSSFRSTHNYDSLSLIAI